MPGKYRLRKEVLLNSGFDESNRYIHERKRESLNLKQQCVKQCFE